MPRPGSTTARGYGWHQHQAKRKRWAPIVAAGNADCRRCGRRIPATPPGHQCQRGCRSAACWDLGHDDHNRDAPPAPEHRHRTMWCIGNRAAGSTISKQIKNAKRRITRTRPRTAERW